MFLTVISWRTWKGLFARLFSALRLSSLGPLEFSQVCTSAIVCQPGFKGARVPLIPSQAPAPRALADSDCHALEMNAGMRIQAGAYKLVADFDPCTLE